MTLVDAVDVVGAALAAESERAALLVLGSRGRGGFRSLLLGSNSLTAASVARCPVVVVRERPANMRDAARDEGTWLHVIERCPAYDHLLSVIREATDRETEQRREERAKWVNPPDAVHRRDVIPADSLGPLPETPTGAVRDLAVGREASGTKYYGTPQMVIRLGMGREVPRTPRRPVEDVLSPE